MGSELIASLLGWTTYVCTSLHLVASEIWSLECAETAASHNERFYQTLRLPVRASAVACHAATRHVRWKQHLARSARGATACRQENRASQSRLFSACNPHRVVPRSDRRSSRDRPECDGRLHKLVRGTLGFLSPALRKSQPQTH